MSDKQYRNLRRMFIGVWFALIVLSIVVLFALLSKPKPEVNNFIGQKGERGDQGVQGIQGLRGEQGLAGASTTVIETNTETVIQNVPVKGEQGAKGDKGDPGEPGASPMLRYNEDSHAIELKYPSDRFWTVLVPACELAVKEEACAKSE